MAEKDGAQGTRDRRERPPREAGRPAFRIRRRDLLISLACFLISLLAMRYLAEANSDDIISGRRDSASYLATTEASRISSSIESYVHVTEVWEQLICESGGRIDNVDGVSSELFDEYGAYLDAIVLAPGDVVSDVYPSSAAAGLSGVNLREEEAREDGEIGVTNSYERAVSTGKTTVTGVVRLPQGGQAIVVHNPVYLQEGTERVYWGMVDAVVSFPDVFNAMGFGGLAGQGYEYRLWCEDPEGGTLTIAESDDLSLDDPVQYTFDVPNGIWTLSLEPKAGWLGASHMESVVAVALSVSVAIGLLAYLVLSAHERQEALKLLSYTDSLTGLANTRSYSEQIAELDAQSDPYAIVAIDVNDFKDINDTFGHATGDAVLERIGERLRSIVRDGDTAYRVGGDEFVVVARGLSDAGACARLAERVRAALDRTDVVDGIAVKTSVSVGCARRPADGSTYAEVTHHADELMYREKQLFHAGESVAGGEAASAAHAYRGAVDELTGLVTMDYYRAFCQRAIESIRAQGAAPAVIFADIDDFKAYNLRNGYAFGDEILVGVARLLREELGETLIARFDADHFVAIAPLEGLDAQLSFLHERALSLGGSSPCELKFGICVPAAAEDDADAHDRAKLACDSLKGRYDAWERTYDDDLDRDLKLRHHITENLERALEEGWVQVWYQPIVRAATGKVCGAEALSRWIDPEWGMVSPAVFIDELERTHLVDQLDRYVARTVCHDAARLQADHPDWSLRLSLNISRADFVSGDPVAMVEDAVTEAGVGRDAIDIEITESAEVGDAAAVRDGIRRFQEAGYQLWIDDFGSGYSSFNLLKDQRFDVLKIDRGLLDDVEGNPRARKTATSVANLAKRLGTGTVAEGIESAGQLAFMRAIGIDMIQGFLYSRPRPARELFGAGAAGVETRAERGYYAAISHVNLLAQSPLLDLERKGAQEGGQDADDLRAVRSYGIMEVDAAGLHVVAGGSLFLSLLRRVGITVRYDPRALHPSMEPDAVPPELLGMARTLAERARNSGKTEFADFVSRSEYGTCQMRHIARMDGRDAYILSIEILSGVIAAGADLSIEEVLHHLYTIFDRIDVFDPAGAHRNVYESASYAYSRREAAAADALSSFAEADIHPDDRERWKAFMDFSTADGRIARAGRGYVGGFFRTRRPDGGYGWQVFYIVSVRHGDETWYLTCAKDALLPDGVSDGRILGPDEQ